MVALWFGLCAACTCFGLFIGCWMDDVAHVCKALDVVMLDPLIALDRLEFFEFLWSP